MKDRALSQSSPSQPAAVSSSFELLAPPVRRWVYDANWTDLRDAQEVAIPLILPGRDDVLISAATAAGKTEAAFLPIVSALAAEPATAPGVQALYIAPLKALINDQFRRLEQLCASAEVPVHRWHGDVGNTHKQALLKNPGGILLTTPESLEARFVLGGSGIPGLFAGLRYVVVDELHAFLGTERGAQLQALLHRLELAVRRRVPRIGLSATLGDMRLAAEQMRPGGAAEVRLVESRDGGQHVKLAVRGYVDAPAPIHARDAGTDSTEAGHGMAGAGLSGRGVAGFGVAGGGAAGIGRPGQQGAAEFGSAAVGATENSIGGADFDADPDSDADAADSGVEDVDDADADPFSVLEITRHLFSVLRGRDNLVFANSRSNVESYADRLREMCEQARLPNEFFPHHGSLGKELREDVEAALKDPARPATAVATTTLEMGIDIGSVASIAQVGPPPGVAALRQRLGRSGRRGEPQVLRVYVRENELDAQSPVTDQLRADLVQTIAMIELLRDGVVEPPDPATLHTSTLIQQVLSVIAQHGGVYPRDAYRALRGPGSPFTATSPARFAALLRALGSRNVLEQSGDGTLLLGPVGERVVNHYAFYAAFATPEEYRLLTRGRLLGTLPIDAPLTVGDLLVFGGRRWRVLGVDEERRSIDLAQATGGRPPAFNGTSAMVHDSVRAHMRVILAGEQGFPYLDTPARDLLAEARQVFARLRLGERGVLSLSLVFPQGGGTMLFPWAGGRVMTTLAALLRRAGIDTDDEGLTLACGKTPAEDVVAALAGIGGGEVADPVELAGMVLNRRTNKYDAWLTDELLDEDYAVRVFDTAGAVQVARRLVAEAAHLPPRAD